MSVDVGQPVFWLSVLEIIWINILLSGDNAVVIALACRALPPRERLWGLVIGAGLAALLRIAFTGVITALMTLPYVRLAGAIALVWIAVKLLAPQARDAEDTPEAIENLWRALRIIVVADFVMSLDNVIAIAAIAKGAYAMLAIGLAISIPIVLAGSAIILAILRYVPLLVWAGAGVLGWVAGDIFASDPVVLGWLGSVSPDSIELASKVAGALIVVAAGYVWRRRHHVPLEEA